MLMEEKSVSRITVSELTEAADINRKTFYNHYSNIDSVLSEMEDNCINWAVSFVKDLPLESLINDPATVYVEIAKGLQRHSDFIGLLTKSGVYPRLSNKMAVSIKDAVLKKADAELKPGYVPKAALLLDFMTAGAVGIYDNMFRNEDPVPLEDAVAFFYDIYERSNIRNLLKEDMFK
jgi:AcrR family transcriptional regulator